MLTKQEKRLRKSILLVVKAEKETTMSVILTKLLKKPYCLSQIKRAVWCLIDCGELDFNINRKFVIRETDRKFIVQEKTDQEPGA